MLLSSHVWMWELDCEKGWAPKNLCFWTVVLEKTLESPLDCEESNQSILKEISPGCSLEGLMLKLKLQYLATWCKELTHLKRPWCWERLRVGGEGDDRGWYGLMASPTQWTWVWVDSGSWWWTGRPGCFGSWGRKESDMTEWLNWNELIFSIQTWVKVYLVSFFMLEKSCLPLSSLQTSYVFPKSHRFKHKHHHQQLYFNCILSSLKLSNGFSTDGASRIVSSSSCDL